MEKIEQAKEKAVFLNKEKSKLVKNIQTLLSKQDEYEKRNNLFIVLNSNIKMKLNARSISDHEKDEIEVCNNQIKSLFEKIYSADDMIYSIASDFSEYSYSETDEFDTVEDLNIYLDTCIVQFDEAFKNFDEIFAIQNKQLTKFSQNTQVSTPETELLSKFNTPFFLMRSLIDHFSHKQQNKLEIMQNFLEGNELNYEKLSKENPDLIALVREIAVNRLCSNLRYSYNIALEQENKYKDPLTK